jgi:hypothetical protein
MRHRTLASVTAAFASAAALAAPADAALIYKEGVRLTATGYDFGGSVWAAGVPAGSGEIRWYHENGKIRARLTGHIHLNDADGTCGRMRMRYYDSDDELIETRYGGEVCVTDDGHHSWKVDLDPYSGSRVDEVEVAVQKETVSGWSTVESKRYRSNTYLDRPKITEQGVDFGLVDFAAGAPMTGGYVNWYIEDGVVRPDVYGYIHINNSAGMCARLKVRYRTEGGALLNTDTSETECAPDNGLHSYSVGVEEWGSTKVGEVKIQLQTLAANGAWQTAGSATEQLER